VKSGTSTTYFAGMRISEETISPSREDATA
jgi:hypothetical protein